VLLSMQSGSPRRSGYFCSVIRALLRSLLQVPHIFLPFPGRL
jgi:hypothetical protein